VQCIAQYNAKRKLKGQCILEKIAHALRQSTVKGGSALIRKKAFSASREPKFHELVNTKLSKFDHVIKIYT
jgi:hypothetical protein